MEYFKDLLVNKRNKFGIALGIIFLVFALSWIPIKISENNLQTFDWIYFSVFTLNGIIWILYGFGLQIEQFFFKAYIRINDKIISMKTGIHEPKQEVLWTEIHEIEYDSRKIIIEKKDKSKILFSIAKLDYSTIQELKNTVNAIANEKNIPYKA